jgi:protein-S-isoprenylcysteine O-methyltransferase Ste14
MRDGTAGLQPAGSLHHGREAESGDRSVAYAAQNPINRSHRGRARLIRIAVNLVGATSAALFARASILFYLHTHQAIGVVYALEQMWFVAVFLVRRPARIVSNSTLSWLLAAAGTFGGVAFRPQGAHPGWGLTAGFVLQLVGVGLAIFALATLGRSFGMVAADRGLVTRGPYSVVRHPVYAAYVIAQCGYLLQAVSVRNIAVLIFVTSCNVGRIIREERVLAGNPDHASYRSRVQYRLVPGIW